MVLALGPLVRQAGRQVPVCLALLLLPLAGCDSCVWRPGPAETTRIELYEPETPLHIREQTPVSPVGVPEQTPVMPPHDQTPDIPTEEPESQLALLLARINEIETGMPYDEVYRILDDPGMLIAGINAASRVYRWNYDSIRLMGRFEDDVLRRKNIVHDEDITVFDREQRSHQLDQGIYDAILPGMTYDEVERIIGMEPRPLTGDTGSVNIYQWTDWRGSTIIGRFEEQVLTRKSGKIHAPDVEEPDDPVTQEAVAPEVPYRFPITWDDAPWEYEEAEELRTDPVDDWEDTVEEPAEPPRVHVAGTTRRQREIDGDPSPHAGRSYQPVARFPSFTRSLRRGDFEIRIHNRAADMIDVALISDEGGQEMTISSGGSASLFVRRGVYALYYIYADDPFTLYQGQQIPVADTLTDFIVEIFDDTYTLRFFDRNLEPGRPQSRR